MQQINVPFATKSMWYNIRSPTIYTQSLFRQSRETSSFSRGLLTYYRFILHFNICLFMSFQRWNLKVSEACCKFIVLYQRKNLKVPEIFKFRMLFVEKITRFKFAFWKQLQDLKTSWIFQLCKSSRKQYGYKPRNLKFES